MRRRLQRLAVVLLGSAAVLCVAAVVARRPLAAWAVEHWLAARGIPSKVVVEDIDLGGATAQLRIGAPRDPDFRVHKATVQFDWSGWMPHLASVELDGPMLRARYTGERLSFGTLDRLIGGAPAPAPPAQAPAASGTPAKPGAEPGIVVRNARLRLEAPAGTLLFTGSGAFADGRVVSLYASADPATLHFQGSTAEIATAVLTKDAQDRIRADLSGSFWAADGTGLSGANLDVDLSALRWYGEAGGLHVSGRARAQITAGEAHTPSLSLAGVSAGLTASGSFNTAGAMNIAASLDASAVMPEDEADAKAAEVPLLGTDAKARDALARDLRRPSIRISSVQILRSAGQTYVTLGQPLELAGGDAMLTVSARHGPLAHVSDGVARGALEAHLEGRELPTLTLRLEAYRWESGAGGGHILTGKGSIASAFDLGPARDARLAASGAIGWRGDRFSFALRDCAKITIGSLVTKSGRMARDAAAQICESEGTPLLTAQSGGWSLTGQWRDLGVTLTSAKARLASAKGGIALANADGTLNGRLTVPAITITDRSHRFPSMTLSGSASIHDDRLTGGFDLARAGQARLGRVTLAGTMARGHADIRLADLAFRPNALQPRDLTPLLATISNANGKASASAHIAWSRSGLSSRGQVEIGGLDFTSPAGRVEGAAGTIRFSSLMPLTTAPNQTITAAKVNWVTPLTGLSAEFAMTGDAIQIAHARATLAQGEVRLGPVTVPLATMGGTQGEIVLDKIDLGQLIAASNLAGKVSATGRLSGSVPFHYGPDGLTFSKGRVESVGPATLSIARSVWTKGEAGTTGAIQDFAYQALEHLSIDSLDGTVDSTPDGRLRLLLHIKGRNAPPEPKAAEVGLFDFLRGKAFDKPVPLPKGTEVNLTLDTSLNFAELLAAYRKAWSEATAQR